LNDNGDEQKRSLNRRVTITWRLAAPAATGSTLKEALRDTAKYVYTFLASHGIDSSRLSYKGFGASRKIFPLELDEEQKEKDRRVEIKILSW
jgi:outer membrane protein OmpA-like peptidoglycan-associated protein